jgi:MFS transporter, AAHS family, 4-hydroxybenzoate transporter
MNTQRINEDSAHQPGRTSRAVWAAIVLCAAVALLDGFDTQAISLAAPAIGKAWHLKSSAFGPVFGIGLFSGLIGATVAGVVGDRIGRKPLVAFGVPVFGVITLATPFTGSLGSLDVVRFLTGIGLGAALPGIIAISSEYAPARSQATVVGLMFCGFPMGAVVGGGVADWLIPAYGWGSVFWIGGAAPLLLLPLLLRLLPESARFLAARGDAAAAERVLVRMGLPVGRDGGTRGNDGTSGGDGISRAVAGAAGRPTPPGDGAPARSPVAELFRQGNGPGTVLLWAAMFLTLLMTYFLVTWLPTVAADAGMTGGLLAVSTLNLGGIVGCLVIGRLADRRAPPW